MSVMRLILNLIWLILCGWWMAILYVMAGIICFILFFLIITIPFGIAAFRIASYVIWPFGRSIVMRREAGIGFIGGGLVIHEALGKQQVIRGITTAAAIFSAAAIGAAAG